uniref:Retrovirus-related Pol polyprotein from transposon TNT 1-94 n=1 Tax=Tanacetum cinerariifolium TaxID=118510 RepID=A0A699GKW8_TANCI|nr:retrovirus-related Pol polyprotein from transposon TNT 1-94 [Tanacetum cinerariifolium]
MLTRSMAAKHTAASVSECLFADFLFEIEPKKVSEALKHPRWVDAIQEEPNQFYKNKVWTLVPLFYRKIAIGSKWVLRNKKDEHGVTTKNKARHVAQGYSQEEEIDYDETFKPLARMEAIRIFPAFTKYMNFIFFHMDVKSVILNGKLKEVYVKQPSGFKSSEFHDYVCKLDKALYGQKQALKACSSVKTPMVPLNNLGLNLASKLVNETSYRGRIGSLMYLIVTRHDISISIVLCTRYHSNPKKLHLIVMKRILRYLKGTLTLGLYYPKCLGFDLKRYSDSDYADCNMDRKSTLGACQILGGKLVCWSAKKQQSAAMSSAKAEYVAAAGCCASTYVSHPSPEAVKAELANIVENLILLHRMPILKTTFPMAWKILFTFVVQVLSGNYSSTEQVNSIQQLIAYYLYTRTMVDIGEIIYSDLITMLINKSRQKMKVLGVLLPSRVAQFLQRTHPKSPHIELTSFMVAVNNGENSLAPLPFTIKKKKGKSHTTLPQS